MCVFEYISAVARVKGFLCLRSNYWAYNANYFDVYEKRFKVLGVGLI